MNWDFDQIKISQLLHWLHQRLKYQSKKNVILGGKPHLLSWARAVVAVASGCILPFSRFAALTPFSISLNVRYIQDFTVGAMNGTGGECEPAALPNLRVSLHDKVCLCIYADGYGCAYSKRQGLYVGTIQDKESWVLRVGGLPHAFIRRISYLHLNHDDWRTHARCETHLLHGVLLARDTGYGRFARPIL